MNVAKTGRAVTAGLLLCALLGAAALLGVQVWSRNQAAVPGGPPSRAAAGNELTIMVVVGGERTWRRLVCAPGEAPAGTHADPEAACRLLERQGLSAFAPDPGGPGCDRSYDPAAAWVTGWWRGRPVDVSLSRTDTCQARRWDRLAAVLTPQGAPDWRRLTGAWLAPGE